MLKRCLALWFALTCLFAGLAAAQPDTDVDSPPSLLDVEKTPPDAPIVLVAAEAPAPEEMSEAVIYAKVATETLLPIVLSIVGGLLLVLGRFAHRWLARKLQVEELIAEEKRDQLTKDVVDGGITFAEQKGMGWARERGELPPSAEKLKWALDWITAEMRRRGLPELAREKLEQLIDSRLGNPKAPGHADRAEVVTSRLRGAQVDA
jgi:hypothetical protein